LKIDPRPQMSDQARLYEVKIQGQLDEVWSDWFEGIEITNGEKMTTLSGRITDQAALRGILSKIWDLNLIVISVDSFEIET